MKLNSAKEYLDDVKKLLSEILVTDKNNLEITIDNAIKESVEIILSRKDKSKKVMIIGNGASAAIASHMSIDLWKNCGVRAVVFNDSSLLTAVSNDIGFPFVFEKPIEVFADEGDVLIAISSSGKSENILNGVKFAKGRSFKVITMSGFNSDNPLRLSGDINFYVPANSYGYVEIVHSALCHCIVDSIMQLKKEK